MSNPLQERIRKMSPALLRACIRGIGGGVVGPDANTVRVALLDEYERRHGGDALDRLLDELGM